MTDDDRATVAEFEIFSGRFDHWADVSVPDGRYECGGCAERSRNYVDPINAFHRHLLTEHLDQVIEAIGQRP